MENTTQNYSKLNCLAYAHKVVSHLVDHGEITFVEIMIEGSRYVKARP